MTAKLKSVQRGRGQRRVVVADDWPYWIGGTRREWRKRKRAELRAFDKALDLLLTGAAYTPMRHLGVWREQVRAWRKEMGTKVWR